MNKNELENRNRNYIDNVDHELLSRLATGQNPSSLVICCSDSRVIPEQIFSSSLGELFVIRTAGNVINEGELATLEYGIEHLKVNNVIVLGHTHCGAVHAAMHNEKGKYLSPILDVINHNIIGAKDEKEASKINAIKVAKYIKEKFPDYKGEIISAIYDIESGKVNWL